MTSSQNSSPSENLWLKALQNLNAHDRTLFVSGTDKLEILDIILGHVENKKKICLAKRWKYQKRNGDVIIIRDVLDKVVTWVEKFKEIGDTIVQYDPVHAALPWAGVRFLLQITVTDNQKFGAMCEGIEVISNLISRYMIFELYYLQHNVATISTTRDQLVAALVKLYSTVLEYLAQANRYYSHGTVSRFVTSTLQPATVQMVEACLTKILEEQYNVDRYARLIDAEYRKYIYDGVQVVQSSMNSLMQNSDQIRFDIQGIREDTQKHATDTGKTRETSEETLQVVYKEHKLMSNGLADIERRLDMVNKETRESNGSTQRLCDVMFQLKQPIERSISQLSEIHDNMKKNERRELLQWLSKVPYKTHHKIMGVDILQNSGRWLLRKTEFTEWRKSSISSILWLHGILGSGKSRLVYMVIENYLSNVRKATSSAPVAYFYCTRNPAEPQRADPQEIMNCILKQLSSATSDLPVRTPVSNLYRDRKQEADDDGCEPLRLTTIECVDLILQLLEVDPAFIIIDALDECNPLHRHELLEALDMIILKSANLVKVFVSSRDDNDIICRLKMSPNIFISASDNSEDISRFISSEVERSIRQKYLLAGEVSDALRRQIVTTLTDNAHGMFRWVSLQIQNMCDINRIKHERDLEHELGRLPTTLKDSYDIIFERIQNSATTSRKIAENAIQWLICAQRPLDKDEFLAAISVHSDGDHLTVSSAQMLDMCCNLVFLDLKMNVFRFAHLSVREYFENHRGYSEPNAHIMATERCLNLFIYDVEHTANSNPGFRFYATLYWPVHLRYVEEHCMTRTLENAISKFLLQTNTPRSPFSRWTSSADTFRKSMGVFHPMRHILDASVSFPLTPLFIASCVGLVSILEFIGYSEKVNWEQRTQKGYTALHLGAMYGQEPVIRFLLRKNVDMDLKDGRNRTALLLASARGHDGVVKLLLEKDVDIEAKDTKYGQTAFLRAAVKGHEKVLKLLLDKGVDIETTDTEYGRTALLWATAKGYKRIVELLLQKGADMGSEDGRSRTALLWAAINGHEAVLELLLKNDVNIEVTDAEYGRTALVWAAKNGYKVVVELLLKKGADIEAKDIEYGQTALSWAAKNGHWGVVKLVLEKGADIEAKDADFGQTALAWAADNGHVEVVGLLLNKEADMEVRDTLYGQTALTWAAERGHMAVVRLLLNWGVNRG